MSENQVCFDKKTKCVLSTVPFIAWNSNLVPWLEGLCSSNPGRSDFSGFGVFAGIEPTTGLTILRSDQLEWASLHRLGYYNVYVQVELILASDLLYEIRKKKHMNNSTIQKIMATISINSPSLLALFLSLVKFEATHQPSNAILSSPSDLEPLIMGLVSWLESTLCSRTPPRASLASFRYS